jgi:hypothetical protein
VRDPVRCSALLGELGGVFGTLSAAAVCPDGWVPETPDRKARRQLVQQVGLIWMCVVLVVGVWGCGMDVWGGKGRGRMKTGWECGCEGKRVVGLSCRTQ